MVHTVAYTREIPEVFLTVTHTGEKRKFQEIVISGQEI